MTRLTRVCPARFYILLTVMGLLLLAGWLAVDYWEWLRTSDGQPQESRSTTIRNVGLLTGGVLALVFALWRSWIAERQADSQQRQTEVALIQANTAQESLRQDRYQRGVQMLGNSLLSVRLGGIYDLQYLANEFPGEFHLQVIELFCAFIRNPTDQEATIYWRVFELDQLESLAREYQGNREDVQAIMSAIGKRSEAGKALEAQANYRLNLRGADLRRINIEGADLSRAILTGANLINASAGGVNLAKADLFTANLYRASCDLANFRGASLSSANMARIRASHADFSEASLVQSSLVEASLLSSDFIRAHLDLTDFSGAYIGRANFSEASISRLPFEPNRSTLIAQEQLDSTIAYPGHPPRLQNGVLDSATGEPLTWHWLDRPWLEYRLRQKHEALTQRDHLPHGG